MLGSFLVLFFLCAKCYCIIRNKLAGGRFILLFNLPWWNYLTLFFEFTIFGHWILIEVQSARKYFVVALCQLRVCNTSSPQYLDLIFFSILLIIGKSKVWLISHERHSLRGEKMHVCVCIISFEFYDEICAINLTFG